MFRFAAFAAALVFAGLIAWRASLPPAPLPADAPATAFSAARGFDVEAAGGGEGGCRGVGRQGGGGQAGAPGDQAGEDEGRGEGCEPEHGRPLPMRRVGERRQVNASEASPSSGRI